jgi:flagellar hook-associated protein 2
MMAGITINGLATGLNTDSIVSQLMALERTPETILNANKTKVQNQLAEYNKLTPLLDSLRTLMAGMNTAATFISRTASVADTSVASVTASSTALTGNHTLKVISLARSQTLVSDSSTNTGYASSTDKNFGTGTIAIANTADPLNPVTINIDSTNNSLQGIAAAINASGAKVTASLINDGGNTPYRLAISGKDTNTYAITSALSGGTYDNPTFNEKLAASQASFQLDGIAMTRTSNTVSEAIPGVTLTLLKQNAPSETTIAIGNDTAGITTKINSFVSNYNSVMSLINQDTTYDATTKTAGILFNESTVKTVKSMLQSVLTNQVSGLTGNYTSLSRIGINSNRQNGTLSVDTTALNNALNVDLNGVVSLFTQNGDTAGLALNQYGIAEQFNRQIDTLTHFYSGYSGVGANNNGIISTRIRGLNDTITNITKQVDDFESRMASMEANLKARFAAMEQLVSNTTAWGNKLLAALGVSTTSTSK